MSLAVENLSDGPTKTTGSRRGLLCRKFVSQIRCLDAM
jgi:hypothetical protein